MSDDKKKPNIMPLSEFRLKGEAVNSAISKKDFANKADWQNLCHMTPPRAEETDAKVGTKMKTKEGNEGTKPEATKPAKKTAKLPGQ